MLERITENKDLFVVAIATFFIGFGAASFFGDSQDNATVPSGTSVESVELMDDDLSMLDFTQQDTGIDAMMETVKKESLTVADQRAGEEIVVREITVREPRWIVVEEVYETDDPGNILGARWISAGTEHDLSMKLQRGTVGGERYRVTIWADVDANKAFDHTVDMPVEHVAPVFFNTVASPNE